MKRAIAAAAALMVLTAAAETEAADAALVIGNGDYANAPTAVSAERDARAVAEALRDAGYEVVEGFDLDRAEMQETLAAFATGATDADRLVIYYSGHAMRMQGATFLAPVDLDPEDEVALALGGVPLEALTALAARRPGGAVFFLDAAQLDGFEPQNWAEPGLADIAPPEGVLVVSAAPPGEAVSRSRWFSSAFSRRVVDAFLRPGRRVAEAAEASEAPIWVAGDTDPDLALVGAPEAPEPASPMTGSGDPATPSSNDISQAIELTFWRSTEAAGTVADYEAYLRRYPNGLFADIARNRIRDAGAPAPQPETAAPSTPEPREPTAEELAAAEEASLGFTRSDRLSIQRDLTELGFDTRGVDGVFGRGTRGAIRQFQAAEALPETGYLARGERSILRDAAQDAIDEREAEAAERARMDAEAARRREDEDWRRARRVDTAAAYRRYLQAYPQGRYAGEARAILRDAYDRAEQDAWREAERIGTAAAYSAYLDQFPDGPNVAEAQRRYDRLTETRPGADESRAARLAWRQAQEENTPRAYRRFAETYPDSPFAREAEARRLALIEARLEERERALGLDGGSWRSLEQRLAFLGFNPGRQDGRVTEETREAILQYRRSRGLPANRYVDKKFIEVLVNESRRPRSGADLLNQFFNRLQ